MSGGGDPVGGGVHATDDRRGTRLPGASEGTGSVQGVQGGDGGGIIGGAQYDTAWASDRGDMDLENLGHRGKSRGRTARPSCPRETHRAARWRNPQYERKQGRQYGYILCTGMSWTPWSFWRRENHPPTVPPMQHAGTLSYTEQKET